MALKAIFVQDGEAIDYTPNADLAAGDVVDLGTFVGITKEPILSGKVGALAIVGTFDVLKFTGASFALGDRVYWDVGTGTAAILAYSEAIMGVCIRAAAAGDSTVRVYLTPGVS